jgi:hypothetical protein
VVRRRHRRFCFLAGRLRSADRRRAGCCGYTEGQRLPTCTRICRILEPPQTGWAAVDRTVVAISSRCSSVVRSRRHPRQISWPSSPRILRGAPDLGAPMSPEFFAATPS